MTQISHKLLATLAAQNARTLQIVKETLWAQEAETPITVLQQIQMVKDNCLLIADELGAS